MNNIVPQLISDQLILMWGKYESFSPSCEKEQYYLNPLFHSVA